MKYQSDPFLGDNFLIVKLETKEEVDAVFDDRLKIRDKHSYMRRLNLEAREFSQIWIKEDLVERKFRKKLNGFGLYLKSGEDDKYFGFSTSNLVKYPDMEILEQNKTYSIFINRFTGMRTVFNSHHLNGRNIDWLYDKLLEKKEVFDSIILFSNGHCSSSCKETIAERRSRVFGQLQVFSEFLFKRVK